MAIQKMKNITTRITILTIKIETIIIDHQAINQMMAILTIIIKKRVGNMVEIAIYLTMNQITLMK